MSNNKKIITGALREEIAKELGVYEQVKRKKHMRKCPLRKE